MYIVHYILYTVQCIMYSDHSDLYYEMHADHCVQHASHNVQCILYDEHYVVLYNEQCTILTELKLYRCQVKTILIYYLPNLLI